MTAGRRPEWPDPKLPPINLWNAPRQPGLEMNKMIYAVNKRTKEHRVAKPGWAFAGDWVRVEADAEGWIPWAGGHGNPLPDGTRCDVKVFGSKIPTVNVIAHNKQSWEGVTHYRPVLDAKPEAPEWDGRNIPPIGAKVLHTANDEEVTVMAHGREGKVCIGDKLGYIGIFHFSELAPLRSEEDRAVEAMVDAMRGTDVMLGGVSLERLARALYRAGLRFVEEDRL